MTSADGDGDSGMQKFELYIKASAIDKETKGADPICQQFFMITCLLGENQDDIDFKVFTVQADCPPKNFAAGWSKKYPVVMVNSGRTKAGQDIGGMMYDTFEELETFFESINKECPELKRKNAPNQAAMQVVENVYKHFNHFVSGQPEKGLVTELRKLNEYLESQETKFLVDDVLSFADCHLLPRLQHIRVAGKAYRDFDIPKDFTYVWRYLRSAYDQDAFKSTMPSDQDIIFTYEKKAQGPPKVGGKRFVKPTLEKFTYTMDIPDDCLNGLDNGTSQQEVPSPPQEPAPREPSPPPPPAPREPSPPPPLPEDSAAEQAALPSQEEAPPTTQPSEDAAAPEAPPAEANAVSEESPAVEAAEDSPAQPSTEEPAAVPGTEEPAAVEATESAAVEVTKELDALTTPTTNGISDSTGAAE